MNEEQLKEIAILAKELGFKPRTLSTQLAFGEFDESESSKVLINDTCYYLLLCEIQLWLSDVHNLIIVYDPQEIPDSDGNYENLWHKFKISTYDGWRGGRRNTVITDLFEEYQTALATGILEGLKLIKNESN
jgi:hypothetical protein